MLDDFEAFLHKFLATFVKNQFFILSHIILVQKESAFFSHILQIVLCYGLTLPQGLFCFPKIAPRKNELLFFTILITFVNFY